MEQLDGWLVCYGNARSEPSHDAYELASGTNNPSLIFSFLPHLFRRERDTAALRRMTAVIEALVGGTQLLHDKISREYRVGQSRPKRK